MSGMSRWMTIAILFISVSARAETSRKVSVGLSLVALDYRENIQSAARSHESGLVPLLNLSLTLPMTETLTVEPALRAMFGASTQFDGTDVAAGKQVEDRDTHDFIHGETLLVMNASPVVAFYAGLSVDWWNRFLHYGSGYREIYQWWVVPLGVRCPLGESNWIVDVAALPMIAGAMKLILSETIQDGDDTLLNLGLKTGWRLKFSGGFDIGGHRWTVSPWYEQESFGRSEARDNATLGAVTEPESLTRRWGVTVSADLPF